MTHLAPRVTSFVRTDDVRAIVRKNNMTGCHIACLPDFQDTFCDRDVYNYLENAKTPEVRLPYIVKSFVDDVRRRLGLTGSSALSKMPLTNAVFRFHIEMSRGQRSFSACPVAKTHRHFAYLDDRVVKNLVNGFHVQTSRGTSDFATTLGVDKKSWNAANRRARNKRRRCDNKRGRCGAGSFPSGWTPTSACTDGVALCVTLAMPTSSAH